MKNKKNNPQRYPGIPLSYFRFLFKKLNETLKTLNYPVLSSPYSLIPLVTQAIGLEIPMLGTGQSPYSLMTYSAKLDSNIFLKNYDKLDYQTRREIITEIYDMLAPYLLEETNDYIELLLSTKYRKDIENFTLLEKAELKNILNKKFKILREFLSNMEFSGGDFSHIAHYGYPEDLYREQNFLTEFSERTAMIWRENSYPIVIEMQLDGYNNAPNKCIRGWYIFVPNYTEELLRNKKLRQKKLICAAKLAKKLKAPFSGMAGLVASFSKGGKYLSDNIKGIGFTTGHSYTVANIYEIIKNISERLSLDLSKSNIAVVGAAGSIGSGVARLLTEEITIKNLILIDRPNMVATSKLLKLKKEFNQRKPQIDVKISKNINDIKTADLIIAATNAPTSIITAKDLKPGAVIIDDSFPKNASRDILKERKDIILLEGGVCQMPKLNIDASRHMPDLLDLSISKLMSCNQAYGCLAETFILAANGHEGNYSLGDADYRLAQEILMQGRKLQFRNAMFQNYGFAVEESRIKRVRGIVKNRFK